MTPSVSLGNAGKRYVGRRSSLRSVCITCRQYGNCFTFILLGKRVTVTLGTHGNDYVLGGKHTQLAAEDVYSVRSAFPTCVWGICVCSCVLRST